MSKPKFKWGYIVVRAHDCEGIDSHQEPPRVWLGKPKAEKYCAELESNNRDALTYYEVFPVLVSMHYTEKNYRKSVI